MQYKSTHLGRGMLAQEYGYILNFSTVSKQSKRHFFGINSFKEFIWKGVIYVNFI